MNALALVLALGLGWLPAQAPAEQSVTVERVVDGDTFVLAGGIRVRPLGIDACEVDTPAGAAATADARVLLPVGSHVTLTSAPGVDLDRYGRELRYVRMAGGRDFGTVMVTRRHTGIYKTGGDAAPEYVAQLRMVDIDGRDCG